MANKLIPLLLSLALALAGCGFHLRGEMDLPTAMQSLYLEGPAASFLKPQIEELLKRAGGKLADSRAGAEAVLNLMDVDEDIRVINLTRGGRANEYDVILKVAYEIKTGKDDMVEPKQVINLTRDYYNDQFLIIGKTEEENKLRADLKTEAAETLLRRMIFLFKQREADKAS